MSTNRLLLPALIALLTACAPITEDGERPHGRIGVAVPAPTVSLDDWQAPAQLGTFQLQGNLQPAGQDVRLYRYVDARRPQEALELVVYSFPGGWEDLDPARVVDGHFPQAREAELARLMRSHRRQVRESLQPTRSDPSLAYPVATSLFDVEASQPAQGSVLMLSAARPLFLRLRLNTVGTAPADRVAEMQPLLVEFQRQLQAHGGH